MGIYIILFPFLFTLVGANSNLQLCGLYIMIFVLFRYTEISLQFEPLLSTTTINQIIEPFENVSCFERLNKYIYFSFVISKLIVNV